MIHDDIWNTLQETVVFPDVIIMDTETFKQVHYEMMHIIYTPNVVEQMLCQLPKDVVLFGIPVAVSDTVKGFELI